MLEATWQLVPHGDPVFYVCAGEPANEIVATFYEAELPAVRLERGDRTEVAVVEQTGSGSRYEGEFGLVFWIKGKEAQVEWPQGTSFTCRVRS
ncbi:MAG: MliC family protein [Geminicoccaceae bacterium]